MVRFLTKDQVQRLYATFISGAQPTQPALLESAIQSPINHKYYGNEQDLFKLAGELSTKIILNHAYPDGNKRIALVAADMFLKINGFQLQETVFAGSAQERLVQAHLQVATSQWTAEDLARFYREIATPSNYSAADIVYYQYYAKEY